MKPVLARKLIGEVLGWSNADATSEFQWLDLMVRYKFDHYQGYGPGRRFYVSLLRWLTQFESADRRLAYKLLRDHLVFVSQAEMHHLVGLSGPLINREMRRHVAALTGLPVYRVDEDDSARTRLRLLQARTLYVGVSDGARIDVFRRFNEGTISNEQVVPMAEISNRKWQSLHGKLKHRLLQGGFSTESAQFEWVCLIDDFTGSATSSIRQESDGNWDGKVGKFVSDHTERAEHKFAKGTCIHIHHYLASALARQTISDRCAEIACAFPDFEFRHTYGYVLPQAMALDATRDAALVSLLQTHYEPSIENVQHTGTGLAMGYKQGGLPLVLEHNTPNNSVAVLWARSTEKRAANAPNMIPLFPRRQRHLDNR